MFQLTEEQYEALKSQIVTSKKRGGRSYSANEFTALDGLFFCQLIMRMSGCPDISFNALDINAVFFLAMVRAERYNRFSEIAAKNPNGWDDEPTSIEAIRDGRMLAFPYTKHHATNWNVDQASALIMTSVGEARRLKIARNQWIFP